MNAVSRMRDGLGLMLLCLTVIAIAASGCTKRELASAPLPAAVIAATTADAMGVPAAPLSGTIVDEKALTLGAKAVDASAVALSALARAGLIEPGSGTALWLAGLLDDCRKAVNAASAARDAGNAATYSEALARLQQTLSQLSVALNFYAS